MIALIKASIQILFVRYTTPEELWTGSWRQQVLSRVAYYLLVYLTFFQKQLYPLLKPLMVHPSEKSLSTV